MPTSAPPAENHTITVVLDDRTVDAVIRRSEQARTTRIRVGSDLPLEVVLPADSEVQDAVSAIEAKANWVKSKLDRIAESKARPRVLGLDEPGVAWLFGHRVPVEKADVRFTHHEDGRLFVPTGSEAADSVSRWYRRTARRELGRLVAEEAGRLKLNVTGVAIRAQRTRWGSCSSAGRISLNWRLLLGPEDVARYVVVHELCHLRVPNHSKEFWRSVERAYPGWRQPAGWLTAHGDELREYDPFVALECVTPARCQ